MAYIDVIPPRPCQVLEDNTWRTGHLRAWQKLDGRWRGFVTYNAGGVGMNKVGWFDQDRLGQGE